ncbi:hypothetical protein A3Q56_02204 [Intoshia linei]|uniref:aspartate transaminase n=1 Tax=Intoshia linei TaxID=1819745 RepID=A0A177B6W4_9BILA|nr:hypothetical protein A3Q56_02204 [Intoshia linei]
MSNWFEDITPADAIEVFHLNHLYNIDNDEKKVNLTIGAYRTQKNEPFVFPVVKKAEKIIMNNKVLNYEYLPLSGMVEYNKRCVELLLGCNHPDVVNGCVDGVQSLGGTGALRIGMGLLAKLLPNKIIYVPNPTWGNHILIAKDLNYEVRKYNYYDPDKKSFDYKSMYETLSNAEEGSVVILHLCAHNPTGFDPSNDRWMELATIFEKRKIFPLFDAAYPGFASDNYDDDTWAVRYFVQRKIELFCAQSFSKIFGLYILLYLKHGFKRCKRKYMYLDEHELQCLHTDYIYIDQRVGNLTYYCLNFAKCEAIKSMLEYQVRVTVSNCPAFGAQIVSTILSNPSLQEEWRLTLSQLSANMIELRILFVNRLRLFIPEMDWDHIAKQKGMFCYSGLPKDVVAHLREKYHIYMLSSGRISICGLNHDNMRYVIEAIKDTYEYLEHNKTMSIPI